MCRVGSFYYSRFFLPFKKIRGVHAKYFNLIDFELELKKQPVMPY